ncbi:hypothetical protein [Microbulbifer sp. ANSA005]|uniref:hypothetical protein n=1 Tax=Microbulbifer sp. ANSA005 TaxID=3243362 RepID=UPI004041BBBB
MYKYFGLLALIFVSACATNIPVEKLSGLEARTHLDHEYWSVSLPGKWSYEDSEGMIIATSPEGQYALYITVYTASASAPGIAWGNEEIKHLKSGKYSRPGYLFDFQKEQSYEKNGNAYYELDGIDVKNEMRLYSKGIHLGSIFYTVSFHDYYYTDSLESDSILELILNLFETKDDEIKWEAIESLIQDSTASISFQHSNINWPQISTWLKVTFDDPDQNGFYGQINELWINCEKDTGTVVTTRYYDNPVFGISDWKKLRHPNTPVEPELVYEICNSYKKV